VVKARALGGEAWGGGEPASSVMESEMRQDRQKWAVLTLSDSLVSYPPVGPA
jgi:hypothetical protein